MNAMTLPLFPDNQPVRYTHDCDACVFLGQSGKYDLYACVRGGRADSVVARYGAGGDYISYPLDVVKMILNNPAKYPHGLNPAMLAAFRAAGAAGYIPWQA